MTALRSILVYPVKSLGAVSLPVARLQAGGFDLDRRFMVVDGQGRFLTQRDLPQMARVEVELTAECLWLRAPGMEPLQVPRIPPEDGARAQLQVWGRSVDAVQCERGDWLGRYLGVEAHLVAVAPRAGEGIEAEPSGFADRGPFLLMAQPSVDDLAARVAAAGGPEITTDRFRPNLVVDGTEPYAEDHWKRIRIGGVTVRILGPCERCSVPGIDPATAETGPEPLRTMASYRRYGGSVALGMLAEAEEEGEIAVGAGVEVLA